MVISDLWFGQRVDNYLGLLVTRTYSLCHRNKIVTAALVFGVLVGLVFYLIGKEQLILVYLNKWAHFI